MQALFQIRSRVDFATLGRLYRYLFLFSPRKLWLSGIYLALCTMLSSYFFFGGEIFTGAMILLILLLYVFVVLFSYHSSYSAHKKRIREGHQAEWVDSVYDVYEDAIQVWDSTGTATRLFYTSIRYAKDRPEEIFLFTKANLMYVLPKNGFTLGTATHFLTFLQSRGVKIKL